MIYEVTSLPHHPLGILYGFQVHVPSLQADLLAGGLLLVHLRGRYILDDLYDLYDRYPWYPWYGWIVHR